MFLVFLSTSRHVLYVFEKKNVFDILFPNYDTKKNKRISFVFGIFSPKPTKFSKKKDFSNSLLFYTDFSRFSFFFLPNFLCQVFLQYMKSVSGHCHRKKLYFFASKLKFFWTNFEKNSLFARFSLFWTENPKNKGNPFVFLCHSLRKKCQKIFFSQNIKNMS